MILLRGRLVHDTLVPISDATSVESGRVCEFTTHQFIFSRILNFTVFDSMFFTRAL